MPYYLVDDVLSLVINFQWCRKHPVTRVPSKQQHVEHWVNSQCDWQIQFERNATNRSYHLERTNIQGLELPRVALQLQVAIR